MGEHLRGTMEMRRWTSTSDFSCSNTMSWPIAVYGGQTARHPLWWWFVYHLKGWCVWSTMEKRNCGQLSGTSFSVKHNDPFNTNIMSHHVNIMPVNTPQCNPCLHSGQWQTLVFCSLTKAPAHFNGFQFIAERIQRINQGTNLAFEKLLHFPGHRDSRDI